MLEVTRLSDLHAQDPVHLAIAGFLARYREPTRSGYGFDLQCFFRWCDGAGLKVFDAKRPHLEVFARQLEESGLARSTVKRRLSTVAGFYRFAMIDGYIPSNPAEYVRRPKVDNESTTLGLDRMELGGFLAAAAGATPMEHALACLLALLGLRVSEACGIDIEHLGAERGHRTVTVLGKGSKLAILPMPPRVFRTVDQAKGERKAGPLLIGRDDERLDRFAAGRVVKRLCRRAGITKRISPHSLRHSAITAALDAGVPLRDVQIFARHADPRTTTRYDRARHNLDRHASYVITAFVAGGA